MKQVFNPYLPLNEYIPDAEPHVFGDRVYIYGSHDKENGEKFCMLDYVTYSASIYDLKNWRYEGVIYKASQDPEYDKYQYMYAPDVVRGNDGRYYLYYSMAGEHPHGCSYKLSVAVSDLPNGKFEYLGYVKNPDGTPLSDYLVFDPALINDNGKIRLYYGMWFDFIDDEKLSREDIIKKELEMFPKKTREQIENTPDGIMGAVTVELCDDMLTVKGKPYHIIPESVKGTEFEEHPFFEASSIRRVGDKYYFVYSSYKNHSLAYATSDYPDRDFKYGGVIISNGDIGLNGRRDEDRLMRTGNIHGGIENINGKWYIFYHRHTHKTEFSRQACAETIDILDDGSIPQVEITSCGLNGGALVADGEYPAPICCNLTNGKMPHFACVGVRLPHITSKNGERYLAEIENGTLIGYKYFDFKSVKKIGVVFRSADVAPSGKLSVKLGIDGDSVGYIDISARSEWTRSECDVSIQDGVYPLYFEYRGDGTIEIKDFYFIAG